MKDIWSTMVNLYIKEQTEENVKSSVKPSRINTKNRKVANQITSKGIFRRAISFVDTVTVSRVMPRGISTV